MKITDIRIGVRHRKDVGDLSELKESIRSIGLLHPIVISPKNKLIAGHRRLVAYKQMGEKTIPARVAESVSDVLTELIAERDENICRKDFTIEEGVGMADSILAVERPKAKEREKAGKSADGKAGGRGKKKPCAKFAQGNSMDRKSTTIAAKAVGMSRPTYRKHSLSTRRPDPAVRRR